MSRVSEEYYTATKNALFPVKWAAPEVILYYKFSSKSGTFINNYNDNNLFYYFKALLTLYYNRRVGHGSCVMGDIQHG